MPYELRLMIYDLVLVAPEPVYITPWRRRFRMCDFARTLNLSPEMRLMPGYHGGRVLCVALLRTCKQINYEGTRVLYGKNHLVVNR